MPAITDFADATWPSLAATVASAFAMSPERSAALAANRAARLVAAIPYAAGCAQPRRIALAHLATFVLAGSEAARRDFDHGRWDDHDLLARLDPIADFPGGDPAVIGRGMKLLATVMINGYRRDMASDKAAVEYNPLNSGAWKAEDRLASLQAELAADKAASPLDSVMTASEALHFFWDG